MSYNVISDYFNHKEAFSTSDIKTILDNPYNYFHGIKKEASKSMDFGTHVHKLILESDISKMETHEGQKIVIQPNFGPQTLKANKEACRRST